jgi:hypothetical protein
MASFCSASDFDAATAKSGVIIKVDGIDLTRFTTMQEQEQNL